MFWQAKPTIDPDDEEWQLGAWAWLLDNLGGIDAIRRHPTRFPRNADFPRSGLSGHAHVEFVFVHLCSLLGLDPAKFELRSQENAINPHLDTFALVQNLPVEPAGTYQLDENREIVTYEPSAARDLEHLISVLAHELCHSILFSIPTRPADWGDNEEFMTDLAVAFHGFGIFSGNQSFQFTQFRDDATGAQGWSTRRLGYLTQNEWGFALAMRAVLTGEDIAPIKECSSPALHTHFKKNLKYLSKNRTKTAALFG